MGLKEQQFTALQLYNSDGQRMETFAPRQPNKVQMYCCGPTVYCDAHIGNMRAYTVQDVLRRLLLALDYELRHVMNITDVGHLSDDNDYGEDKMLLSARRKGKNVADIANHYTEAFFCDCAAMCIAKPDIICRASDHIVDMQNLIAQIEAAGFTYYSNGNLYFDTGKLTDYGRLAGLDRVLESATLSRTGADRAKKNQRDFVLWFSKGKFAGQALQWDSPWGKGYPGWHIECSAMASHFLGMQIDIHCGGVDHKTVHHPNEIAQSESILQPDKKPWVRFWLHNEFVVIKAGDSDSYDKISKNSGITFTLKDLQKNGYNPLDYRYFLLGSHYRSQVQFHFQALDGAQKSRKRLWQKAAELQAQCQEQLKGRHSDPTNSSQIVHQLQTGQQPNPYIQEFFSSLLQDINTPQALACLWDALKDKKLSPKEKLAALEFGEAFLQIGLFEAENHSEDVGEIPQQYLQILAQRDAARRNKNYARADQLRAELQAAGYQIVDTAEGSTLTR